MVRVSTQLAWRGVVAHRGVWWAANALTSLEGLGSCPALRRLEATMNALTSLDAGSSFPILQELLLVRGPRCRNWFHET
jgi:hypothetical protein